MTGESPHVSVTDPRRRDHSIASKMTEEVLSACLCETCLFCVFVSVWVKVRMLWLFYVCECLTFGVKTFLQIENILSGPFQWNV